MRKSRSEKCRGVGEKNSMTMMAAARAEGGQCLRSRVDNTGLRTTGGLRFEDTQSSTGVNCEV